MAVANATAVWRSRPGGSNTNGGGYDPGIAGAGTDLSQSNTAAFSNLGTCSTATTTLTDTGASFTTALIGNGIRVAGTGITTTFTYIIGVPSATTLTLQASPGTTGASVTYSVGGAWADFWTNTTSAANWLVPGNIVYILGGASPSYASPDYTAAQFTPVAGNNTVGAIQFLNDPNTPPTNGFAGFPVIKCPGLVFFHCAQNIIQNLWLFASATTSGRIMDFGLIGTGGYGKVQGCVVDQNGFDISCIGDGGDATPTHIIGNEFFSSSSFQGTKPCLSLDSAAMTSVIGNNFHDLGCDVCLAFQTRGLVFSWNIVAKNKGTGFKSQGGSAGDSDSWVCSNNTFDANTGHGIEFTDQTDVYKLTCLNNIISNHVTAGKSGILVLSGSTTVSNALRMFVDYNTFYNNTSDVTNIGYGPHDTSNSGTAPNLISSSPYVAQSTENYTLA